MKIYVGTVGTGFEDDVVCVQLTREQAEYCLDLYYTKYESERLAGYYIEVWETITNKESDCIRYNPRILAGPDGEPCDVWEIEHLYINGDELFGAAPLQIYLVSHKTDTIEEEFAVNMYADKPDPECALRIAKGE